MKLEGKWRFGLFVPGADVRFDWLEFQRVFGPWECIRYVGTGCGFPFAIKSEAASGFSS